MARNYCHSVQEVSYHALKNGSLVARKLAADGSFQVTIDTAVEACVCGGSVWMR